MILRKAMSGDLRAICDLYEHVSGFMESHGLKQWHWGVYPNRELVERDLAAGRLYCLYGEHGMAIVVSVAAEADPAYGSVNWHFGVHPGAFHRLAIHPSLYGRGLEYKAVEDVQSILISLGCDCLRCDTGEDNEKVLRFYEELKFRRAGVVSLPGRSETFIAYEKRLVEHCPLLPVRMHPAFRGGALTPWGGEKLRDIFGKDIRDVPTGESLEASCIPGLESTDDTGAALTELVRYYGYPMAGAYATQPFPLLLKLIDAREALSVQVHPDDSYAREHEGGKLGKTEAWLILDAPEGAELVYGIRPGTGLDELRSACEQGSAVEPLLRRVKVKAGDVCFIPSGCVHAIGAGITLYEIQQSSDITYRFYDWNRVNEKGERRQLHLEQALAVTDLSLNLQPIPAPDVPCARVLNTAYFTLDLLQARDGIALPPICHFGLLTALD